MSFRSRLENSKALEAGLSAAIACYLRLCLRTTRWQSEGLEPLKEALRDGPVILVLWHSRLVLAAAHWPHECGRASTLVDTSPIARLLGAIQRRFGIAPIHIKEGRSGLDTTRDALRLLRGGSSLGLAADGPTGPAHKLRDPPLEWARVARVPVFVYAYSTRRHRKLNSWDKTMFPRPFSTGAYVYRRWPAEIPRRLGATERRALRRDLTQALDAVQAEADAMVGLDPQP